MTIHGSATVTAPGSTIVAGALADIGPQSTGASHFANEVKKTQSREPTATGQPGASKKVQQKQSSEPVGRHNGVDTDGDPSKGFKVIVTTVDGLPKAEIWQNGGVGWLGEDGKPIKSGSAPLTLQNGTWMELPDKTTRVKLDVKRDEKGQVIQQTITVEKHGQARTFNGPAGSYGPWTPWTEAVLARTEHAQGGAPLHAPHEVTGGVDAANIHGGRTVCDGRFEIIVRTEPDGKTLAYVRDLKQKGKEIGFLGAGSSVTF